MKLLARSCLSVVSTIILGVFALAQTKPASQTEQGTALPQPDELAAARAATNEFLTGVKLAQLPEGRELLLKTQWITGEADYGRNFYFRPQFTESTTVFEKLFDTDVPGVRGYKRLLDMKMVSEAGTTILTQYFIVAFKDRQKNEWKVLHSGTDEGADVDRQVAYFGQALNDDNGLDSKQDLYLSYGQWLLLDGQIKKSRGALMTAQAASQTVPAFGSKKDTGADLHVLQIRALLEVINAIAGD